MSDDDQLLTISEVLALFDVSETTVKRDRQALKANQEKTGRKAWLYRRSSLEARYSMRDNMPEPDEPNPETAARIVELELRADYDAQELARAKAERDQARNDLEHERCERSRCLSGR